MHHQELWSWQAYRAESQRRVTFRLGLSSSPSVWYTREKNHTNSSTICLSKKQRDQITGYKADPKKIVVNCDRFLQMIFWHGNDKLRSNKLLSCTKGNTLLNWIQKENLYCSVLYKKEDYKEREREHSLKREREPQKTNVLLELATSTAWCSGPHLDVLQPPYKPWEYPLACGQTLIIIFHA